MAKRLCLMISMSRLMKVSMETVSFSTSFPQLQASICGIASDPIQELTRLLGDAKVYIDDDGIIYDASLNQTNIGGNNNKVS